MYEINSKYVVRKEGSQQVSKQLNKKVSKSTILLINKNKTL